MASRNRFVGVLINPIAVEHDELRALTIPVVLIGSRDDFPDPELADCAAHNWVLK